MSVFLLVGLATAQQPDAFQDYVDGEVRVRKFVGNLTTLLSTKRYNIFGQSTADYGRPFKPFNECCCESDMYPV